MCQTFNVIGVKKTRKTKHALSVASMWGRPAAPGFCVCGKKLAEQKKKINYGNKQCTNNVS
jgi:hypothetical protein